MRSLAGKSRTVVVYARVSSEEQEKEGFSIPAQIEAAGRLRGARRAQGCQGLRRRRDGEGTWTSRIQ